MEKQGPHVWASKRSDKKIMSDPRGPHRRNSCMFRGNAGGRTSAGNGGTASEETRLSVNMWNMIQTGPNKR